MASPCARVSPSSGLTAVAAPAFFDSRALFGGRAESGVGGGVVCAPTSAAHRITIPPTRSMPCPQLPLVLLFLLDDHPVSNELVIRTVASCLFTLRIVHSMGYRIRGECADRRPRQGYVGLSGIDYCYETAQNLATPDDDIEQGVRCCVTGRARCRSGKQDGRNRNLCQRRRGDHSAHFSRGSRG